jgi:nucleoside-diphosphate-sugar epimerase
MRILIIGGTGLISTSTAHILAERGEQVVLYNRGQSIYPTAPGVTTVPITRLSKRKWLALAGSM